MVLRGVFIRASWQTVAEKLCPNLPNCLVNWDMCVMVKWDTCPSVPI